jgi:hypothetical protein
MISSKLVSKGGALRCLACFWFEMQTMSFPADWLLPMASLF